MTIGLLLPQSSLYPTLPFDLVEGLRAGLDEVSLADTKLVLEGIDYGTNPANVQTKAQKLLLQEGADVVVGMVSKRVGDALAPMFATANRLLLVLDVIGEFFSGQPSASEAPTSHVYYHSLQTCAGTWLAGRDAAALGPVIQTASYYDSGYLQGYAVSQGVAAGGSTMGQWAISPLKTADFTLAQLQTGLEQDAGNSIVALYTADMAEQFFAGYVALPPHRDVPIWGGPLLLEEQTLAKVPYQTEGIRGYVAWSQTLDNPLNQRFQEALRRRGRHPNLFSLLAYEAASILLTYLADLSAIDQLATSSFDSPRGTITMNATTHYTSGPLYEATVLASDTGHCRLHPGAPVSTNDPIDHLLAQGQLNTYANWFNTYLCI
ncbi:ABC transporter substrate-binding protein [Fibrella sp. HMF5335]|uniref:ABC transporter substrate-binding protein n=1 Tax=Fibrella rubiginis TaxID=2817060 RepID=A0A939GKH1_9BACT|nr:ABC transporter substrate-binding protein [Fibrella rubiginis]MBO0939508.1 ABC transporter substrate-binding protein [Fibrella rubiginis]